MTDNMLETATGSQESNDWEEEREELQELSMSDEEDSGSYSTPPKFKYTTEQLMAFRGLPVCGVKPQALKRIFFDETGLWNPNLWHASFAPSDRHPRFFPSGSKNLHNLAKRIQLDDVPVLSPHRESFGPGCHVNGQTNECPGDKENCWNAERRERRGSLNGEKSDRNSRDSNFVAGNMEFAKRSLARTNSVRGVDKVDKHKSQSVSFRNRTDSDVNNNKTAPRLFSSRRSREVAEKETLDSKDRVHRKSCDDPQQLSQTDLETSFENIQQNPQNMENHRSDQEPEWLCAADHADLEFDFGNLEDLKKEFNQELDGSKLEPEIITKPDVAKQTSFDINAFFQSSKRPEEALAEPECPKESRLAQLFSKQPEIASGNAVLECSSLESKTVPENSTRAINVDDLERPYLGPISTEPDLKAFNDFLSKFKTVSNPSEENSCRIASPGLELFGTTPENARPFSPFSNPDGPKMGGAFHAQNTSKPPLSSEQAPVVPHFQVPYQNGGDSNVKQSRLAHLFERPDFQNNPGSRNATFRHEGDHQTSQSFNGAISSSRGFELDLDRQDVIRSNYEYGRLSAANAANNHVASSAANLITCRSQQSMNYQQPSLALYSTANNQSLASATANVSSGFVPSPPPLANLSRDLQNMPHTTSSHRYPNPNYPTDHIMSEQRFHQQINSQNGGKYSQHSQALLAQMLSELDPSRNSRVNNRMNTHSVNKPRGPQTAPYLPFPMISQQQQQIHNSQGNRDNVSMPQRPQNSSEVHPELLRQMEAARAARNRAAAAAVMSQRIRGNQSPVPVQTQQNGPPPNRPGLTPHQVLMLKQRNFMAIAQQRQQQLAMAHQQQQRIMAAAAAQRRELSGSYLADS